MSSKMSLVVLIMDMQTDVTYSTHIEQQRQFLEAKWR